jgi:ferrous-iron efflux pump FieF
MNAAVDAKDARLRRRAAIASLSVGIALVAIKVASYYTTQSVGVLSSLMDSMLDGVASALTLFGVTQAQKPPDQSYRFGHGKAEALAALAQAAFIIGSVVLLCLELVQRFVDQPPIRHETTGMIALGISSLIIVALMGFQAYVVRRTRSIAIEADLRHYIGDIMVNVAVIAGLILTARTGNVLYDSGFALLVAVFLLVNAWGVGRQALRLLMDRELDSAERQAIKATVLSHPHARGIHDLRTRSSGSLRFIELHLELDGGLTLIEAHDISDEIEQRLRRTFTAEVLIHQEPAGLVDERLDERIAEASQNEARENAS